MSRIVGIDILMFEFVNVFSDDLFRFRGRLKNVSNRFAEGDAVKAVAPQQPRFLFLHGFGDAVFDLCQIEIGVLEIAPRE